MKKFTLSFALFLIVKAVFADLPMTSLLTIEQGTLDVKSFEFWLESDSGKFHYFKYSDFEKRRDGDRYFNTNLFAYTNHYVKNGNYRIKMRLLTIDSIFLLNEVIDLNDNIIGLSITSLIGQAQDGQAYLQDVEIVRHIKNDSIGFYLKPLFKFELNTSPEFIIVNETNIKLYPYNHFHRYYGDVVVYKKNEWRTFDYVQPYIEFDCPPEYINSEIHCYFITQKNCEKRIISERGRYLYEIDISNDEIESSIPNDYIVNKRIRIRQFESFTLKYEFIL